MATPSERAVVALAEMVFKLDASHETNFFNFVIEWSNNIKRRAPEQQFDLLWHNNKGSLTLPQLVHKIMVSLHKRGSISQLVYSPDELVNHQDIPQAVREFHSQWANKFQVV